MQTCTWSPFLSVTLPSKGQGQTCEAPPLAKKLLAVHSRKKKQSFILRVVVTYQSVSNPTYMYILATLIKLSF